MVQNVAEPVTSRSKKADTRPAKRTAAQIRAAIRQDIPELAECMSRYMSEWNIAQASADLLTADLAVSQAFEQAVAVFPQPQTVAKWFVNVLLGELKERSLADTQADGAELGHLIRFVDQGDISSTAGKAVLAELFNQGGMPTGTSRGIHTGAIGEAIEGLTANPDKVEAYQSDVSFGFFVIKL